MTTNAGMLSLDLKHIITGIIRSIAEDDHRRVIAAVDLPRPNQRFDEYGAVERIELEQLQALLSSVAQYRLVRKLASISVVRVYGHARLARLQACQR